MRVTQVGTSNDDVWRMGISFINGKLGLEGKAFGGQDAILQAEEE